MNWLQLAQTIDPNLTDDEADCLLWNRTCFGFGNVRQVYTQLRSAIRARNNKIRCCELCHNKLNTEKFACQKCTDSLKRINAA